VHFLEGIARPSIMLGLYLFDTTNN